jgi:hypothetical protein
MSTVTPVLPFTAATGVNDGLGAAVLHVVVSPLAGATLSHTANAELARSAHVAPTQSDDHHDDEFGRILPLGAAGRATRGAAPLPGRARQRSARERAKQLQIAQ